MHDGNQDGLVGNGIGHLLRIDPALIVYRNRSHLVAHRLKALETPYDGIVFDVRCDDVLALIGIGHRHSLDGMIDRFGAAGVEHHFLGHGRIDQFGDRNAGTFDGFGGGFAAFVLAGRIMVVLVYGIDHRRFHFRQQRFG